MHRDGARAERVKSHTHKKLFCEFEAIPALFRSGNSSLQGHPPLR